MTTYLPFEKSIETLERSAAQLRQSGERLGEAAQLEERAARQLAFLYSNLTPWQRTAVARHADRPHLDLFVSELVDGFVPLAGDRAFADDQALIGGLARFNGQSVMLIGNAKGNDTQSRIRHNFGMAKPEGYRKAIRLLELADRFGIPVITLIDTPGAFPGIDAEERGQAEAIARCTQTCLGLRVPMIAVIVGEGGSGGAVALAAANRVLMLEHAIYSVISPEGCASILWRSADRAADAAEAMQITAASLLKLGVIDRIIYEPPGGAHRDRSGTVRRISTAIAGELAALLPLSADTLKAERRAKFLAMGAV